jgi:hypothetical protein
LVIGEKKFESMDFLKSESKESGESTFFRVVSLNLISDHENLEKNGLKRKTFNVVESKKHLCYLKIIQQKEHFVRSKNASNER